MIKIIPSDKRHFSDFGWLKTHWLFSFSNYFDPENIQFGALRVFNDDIVAPGTGFPTHPHREMEIITIALEGAITHRDSMGNQMVIRAGDVQRMSAGTGLTHSEYNLGNEPVHFYQIWIYPDKSGLKPSYEQKAFRPDQWHNKLLPVASGQGIDDTVGFHTDAGVYRSSLDSGGKIEFAADESRRVFIYVTNGGLSVNGTPVEELSQARIDLETELSIVAERESHFILIDVPSCRGYGYDEKTLKGDRA